MEKANGCRIRGIVALRLPSVPFSDTEGVDEGVEIPLKKWLPDSLTNLVLTPSTKIISYFTNHCNLQVSCKDHAVHHPLRSQRVLQHYQTYCSESFTRTHPSHDLTGLIFLRFDSLR